jgi:trypsin-like peptidase
MRNLFLRVLLLVFLAGAGYSFGLLIRPEPEHPAKLTALVDTPTGWGSAIPVHNTQDGLTIYLTAKHVVESAQGEPFRVGERLVLRFEAHPTLDIAAVWVQGTLPTVPFSFEHVPFGARVESAGFQFGQFFALMDGLVSGQGWASLDSLPGCSGGPVFYQGRLVGITIGSMRANTAFGPIPIGALCQFVEISEVESELRAILRR